MAKDLKPDVEDRVSNLQIPGIVTEGVSKRVYPNGSVAGGIIGFLQDGNSGQAGIEQTQDGLLRGEDGKRLFEIGADGLRIPVGVDELTPPKDGKDVKLTLNSDLQYFAQQAIQSQSDKLSAEWGSILVMDVKTGNIVAMADTNAPDPNDPGRVAAKDRGVRTVTAAYEPGSVQKMITASALIEEGKSSPLDTFTLPPSYTIDGQTFTDAFTHGTEERTLAGILGYSMNTGTVAAGSRLTKDQRYDWLRKFGIGEAPDIGLPAIASGILAPADQWDSRQQYTVLFGQGVSQSTLQTVRAFQTIANKGVMLQPRLIDSYVSADGTEEKVAPQPSRQVVSDSTAQQVRDILESAVTEGADQGRRHRRLPRGCQDRNVRVPVRRRQVRLLRLHGLHGGDGADGRSAVYCGGGPAASQGQHLRHHQWSGLPVGHEPGTAHLQRPAVHRRTGPAAAVRQVTPGSHSSPPAPGYFSRGC